MLRYEGVAADILAWGRKLRTGGSFIFNDYKHEWFPEVTRAVDDFVQAKGLKLIVGSFGVPPGLTNAAVIL